MIVFNIIQLSIRNFKNMRLRSILTVLGIGIGIGTILFLVSFGQGLQRLLIKRITTAEALLALDVAPAGDSLVTLDKTSIKRLSSIEAITEISPVKSEKTKIRFEGVTAGSTAHFVEGNFFRLAGLEKFIALSSKPDESKKENKGKVIFPSPKSMVVSQAVLDLLSLKDEPIGKKVNVTISNEDEDNIISSPYTISGILQDNLNSFIYLPSSSYPQERLHFYTSLKIRVKSTMFLENVRNQIIAEGFIVSALSDTVAQANKVFRIMQIILAIFGAIALMVAAIGMFNTMTIALLERTNEIGIMRAIGASRRDIWLMFLSEAVIIGFLGGVSGIGIGIGAAEISNLGLNFLASRLGGQSVDIFYYPPWFVTSIILFSTAVALITGFYPAQRAANLNPLEALRYK